MKVIKTAALKERAGSMTAEDFAKLKVLVRTPEVTADAAYVIFNRSSKDFTQNFCIDEDVLREEGVTDFEPYAATLSGPL